MNPVSSEPFQDSLKIIFQLASQGIKEFQPRKTLMMHFEQEMSKFKSLDFHPSQFSFFKECLDEHDGCNKAVGLEHGLPRRLVDLSSNCREHTPSKACADQAY
jgi:hypothetical protein